MSEDIIKLYKYILVRRAYVDECYTTADPNVCTLVVRTGLRHAMLELGPDK